MEHALERETERVTKLVARQDHLEHEVRVETSTLQNLQQRAREALSEFEKAGDEHLEAASRIMAEALRQANDPQKAALEQMRLREVARDRTEKRKFIVQIMALVMTSATTISGAFFVSRSGSHEGAHQALSEQRASSVRAATLQGTPEPAAESAPTFLTK